MEVVKTFFLTASVSKCKHISIVFAINLTKLIKNYALDDYM